jgi:hypothetical protein
MLFVDRAGFALDSLEFRRAANAPDVYQASSAAFTGQVVVNSSAGGMATLGNVGQLEGSVTMGVGAKRAGPNHIRIRYANGGRAVRMGLVIDGGELMQVVFPNTGGGDVWKDLDLTLDLLRGANQLRLFWDTTGYDSIGLQSLTVVNP